MDDSHSVDDTDLRGRSIRSASALMVGQVLRFGISMVSQVYLARLLLPGDFGLVAMIAPIIGFVQLFSDFGLLQAVIQRRTITQALLNTVFWINMVISLGLALLFAALTPLLVLLYGEPRLAMIGFVSSAMILVTGLGQLPSALLTRQLRFGIATFIDITGLLAGLAAGITGALYGLHYWALVISPIVTTCISTILTIGVVRWHPSAPARNHEALAMLRFGGQVTGSRVVGYLNSSADNLMIGAVLGGPALGIYDRSWRLAALTLQQLSAPVDRLAMPVLSRLQDDPDRYRRAFRQMTRLLLLIATPGLLYGVVAADRFIPVLLGPHWLAAVDIFRWVCFGALISPLNSACFWLFISQGRVNEQLKAFTVVSIINIAAYAIGLVWGLEGVARSSALSVYILQTPILTYTATRSGPVDLPGFLRTIWPGFVAVAFAAPILFFLVHALPQESVAAIIFGGACAYALTGAVLLCSRAGRETLTMAWGVISTKMTRPVERVLAGLLLQLRWGQR